MRDTPPAREEVQFLLEGIGQNSGAGLLRVKGLVNVAEEPGRPAVIQGAQHLLHTMTWLDRWPDADQRTRVVFITQGIQRESLKEIIDLLDRVSSRTFQGARKGAPGAGSCKGDRADAMTFDIIIIGSGPGGYVAAIRAAKPRTQDGHRRARASRRNFRLNWGCIPTKALLRSAEVFELMRHAKDYGLAADNVRVDAKAIVQRSRSVSGRLSRGVEGLLKKNNVQVIWGEGRLTAPSRLSVSEPVARSDRPRPDKPAAALGPGDYSADHIIVASGARPRVLPGLEPDGERVWTYFEAMVPQRIFRKPARRRFRRYRH